MQGQAITEKEHKDALIQIHIAEYQALTTRVSYWLILQASLLPIIPIYLALAIEIYKSGVIIREIVVWVNLIGLQMIGIVWAQTMVEHYNAVKYIECHLRPLIKNLVSNEQFWGYELHLSWKRPISPKAWEYPIPILGIIVILITGIARYQVGISWWDLPGVAINLFLLLVLWRHILTAMNIRNEWSKYHRNLSWKLGQDCDDDASDNDN